MRIFGIDVDLSFGTDTGITRVACLDDDELVEEARRSYANGELEDEIIEVCQARGIDNPLGRQPKERKM